MCSDKKQKESPKSERGMETNVTRSHFPEAKPPFDRKRKSIAKILLQEVARTGKYGWLLFLLSLLFSARATVTTSQVWKQRSREGSLRLGWKAGFEELGKSHGLLIAAPN